MLDIYIYIFRFNTKMKIELYGIIVVTKWQKWTARNELINWKMIKDNLVEIITLKNWISGFNEIEWDEN